MNLLFLILYTERKLSAILCDFHMKWVAQLKLKSQREFRFPSL